MRKRSRKHCVIAVRDHSASFRNIQISMVAEIKEGNEKISTPKVHNNISV